MIQPKDSTKETSVQVFDPMANQWLLIQRQCKAFLESNYLPKAITSISQAVTIAWKGHELGMPPLYSFSMIVMINGTPCLRPEAMLALTYQKIKGAKVTFKTPLDKQNTECVVEMQRPDGEPQQFRFTIEDAKRAGLVRAGSGWEKYPAAYLRARVIGAGCRAVFPDAIMGCYTPEEMGKDLDPVDVQVTTSQPPEKKLEDYPNGTMILNGMPVIPIHMPKQAPDVPSPPPQKIPEFQHPLNKTDREKVLKAYEEQGAVAVYAEPKFPFEEEPPPISDDFAPPTEELAQVLSQATKPIDTRTHNSKTTEWPKANPNWVNEPCTPAQLRRLHIIGKEHGYNHDKIKEIVQDKFGKESTTELTKAEIQTLFLEMEKPTT